MAWLPCSRGRGDEKVLVESYRAGDGSVEKHAGVKGILIDAERYVADSRLRHPIHQLVCMLPVLILYG